MKVTVVLALPARQQLVNLEVAAECSARDAVQMAIEQGLDITDADVDIATAPLGVFGEHVTDDAVLQDGDRVEIYRPLQQDPKELRRRRAASEAGRLTKRRK